MTMTFGIHIGHMGGPLDEMRRLWKFADEMGFDWFSVSDHFQESPPRGGDMDTFEAITTLTAAAVETKHIRLGSGVYCLVYRNPGLLAKSLTTIDHLSGGRVDCGLGAGWSGSPPCSRRARRGPVRTGWWWSERPRRRRGSRTGPGSCPPPAAAPAPAGRSSGRSP